MADEPVVLPRAIDNAITRFEQAAIDMSWRGSQGPLEHTRIVNEYKKAKINLRRKIKDKM